MNQKLRDFLNAKVEQYNQPSFIAADPISVPHQFSSKQDIEIAGFFAAIFSWGHRTIIINKSKELMELMDNAPYQFITQHTAADLKPLLHFKHRTFNTDDLLYFIHFFQQHYQNYDSLEAAFCKFNAADTTIETGLNNFKSYFFSYEHVHRTQKHISSPLQKSSCKRINMYLRWMVRNDKSGVDFGIWKTIKPSQLICPLDVHVIRVAKGLGLMQSEKSDWKSALELTEHLRELDPKDPVKYDFALFGLGVMEKY